MKEGVHNIKIDAHKHIALWKYSSDKSSDDKHILMVHGTFSNRRVFRAICDFFTLNGYTCWVHEWRNHGASSKTKDKFNFETIAKEDLLAIYNFLFNQQQINKIETITHSGGGICLTISLIEYPQFQENMNTITMFGCQAFGASNSTSNYLKILGGKYMGKVLGYIPASKIGSAHDESYTLMKQWFDWNLSKQFYGENKVDYRALMPNISLPVLSISGKGDTFIAPASGCESFLLSFQNPNNRFLCCGKENGFLEDYNHGRILHSSSASKEIYPIVLNWIENNSHAKLNLDML